jgi:hypothetical protein
MKVQVKSSKRTMKRGMARNPWKIKNEQRNTCARSRGGWLEIAN